MKTYIAIIAMALATSLSAQEPYLKAGNISNVHLQKDEAGQHINFSVSSQANIKQYIIEGRTDSCDFEIIGFVPSWGNCVTPRYFEFITAEDFYTWYRIKQIDMTGLSVAAVQVFAGKYPAPIKIEPLLPPISYADKTAQK